MATNKLMEAAAEILAGSKSSAPGMPMPKLSHDTPGNSGTPEDLGGPTPQNNKPTDDSNKLSSKGSAKSAAAPTTKPSAASSDVQLGDKNMKYGSGTNMMPEEEEYEEGQEQLDELSKSTLGSYVKKASWSAVKRANDTDRAKDDDDLDRKVNKYYNRQTGIAKAADRLAKEDVDYSDYDLVKELRAQMHEDIQALFADDQTISEDFKVKAATIFEARVMDRVGQIQEELEGQYAAMLEEAVEDLKNELTEKVDDYLSYVVEQWIDQNEIAIESGLRAELTEEFIAGLRNLFAEHYIDVPTEKVDLVDELATKVEELEGKLNEEIERGIELKKSLVESHKQEITHAVCEGLTATQVEKIKSLAESVDFSTEEEYKEKLETIRENYFPSGVKKADAAQLHEQVEDADEKKVVITDPFVAAVSQAISKTKLQ
jgi:hypothetical protein